jgi:ABC-type antimicrobial peptide transport system permease subunit
MFRNYLVTAIRAATRQKLHTAINLGGLIIGIAGATLIYLWVLDELSYDRFNANEDTLYRVEQNQYNAETAFHVNITSGPLSVAAKEEIPEIVDATRMDIMGEVLLRHGETAVYENGVRIVDPSFLSMFTYPLIEGDSVVALSDPYSVVMSQSAAVKLFGRYDNVVGQSVILNNEHELFVRGVFKDVPENSVLSFNMLVPYKLARILGQTNDSWELNNMFTFVQLASNANVAEVAEKISALNYAHTEQGNDAVAPPTGADGSPRWDPEYSLRLVKDVYLKGYFGYAKPGGRMKYIYILSGIGLLVLLIACINFMNLTTSRASLRAREVSLRKTIGAVRSQLAFQHFGETIGLSLIAATIALVLVKLILPSFNTWSEKALALNLFGESHLFFGVLGIVLMTAAIAGSYPALILSSFKPRAFLSGQMVSGRFGRVLRQSTVAFQFVISAILLIGTAVVINQVDFMSSKGMGYDAENLLTLRLRGNMVSNYETLKQRLSNHDAVEGVTGAWQHPAFNGANTGGINWPGKSPDDEMLIGLNFVDADYIGTMGIEILEGRAFDRQRGGDSINAYVINEEFARHIGNGSVIGKSLSDGSTTGTIIGVTKSFHRTSLRRKIEPTFLVVSPERLNWVVVRLSERNRTEGLAAVRKEFEAVYPDYPFEYSFFNESLDGMYRSEEQMASLLRVSGMIAIIVACLGMFGLASYSAERRLREMAVRKTLGASSGRIFKLFSKEYLYVVGFANLVAIPIAYYLASRWLQDFVYRVDLQPMLFLQATLLTIVVAFIAISSHSIKTASTSPAKVLRSE